MTAMQGGGTLSFSPKRLAATRARDPREPLRGRPLLLFDVKKDGIRALWCIVKYGLTAKPTTIQQTPKEP